MADLYTRSTTGVGGNSGATWALARDTVTNTTAVDAAGDRMFYSQVHAETTAASVTVAVNGTITTPSQMLCANDAAQPPTALATTGSITTTGASTLLFLGSFYCYGLIFNCADAATTGTINLVGSVATSEIQRFEQCQFILPNTSASSVILIGHMTASVPHKAVWRNSQVKFNNVSQRIQVSGADFIWRGGSAITGTTTPTSGLILNAGTGRAGNIVVDGVDLSNFSSALALVSNIGMSARVVFRSCKLPAAWAGALFNAAPTNAGLRAEMYNCDSADTNYRLHVEDCFGTIKSEVTLVKTGGASDGTTPFSFKMASTANVSYPLCTLESIELPAVWNTTVGSTVTITVDILRDSVTALSNADIWLTAQYAGTTGFPIASLVENVATNVLTTATSHATSAAAWTTTGMTNPNMQKLVVTFTATKIGYVQARIHLAKASTVVYIDPKLQVS